MTQQINDDRGLISIARIARTQGQVGEVAAELLTDFPERFVDLHERNRQIANGNGSTVKADEFVAAQRPDRFEIRGNRFDFRRGKADRWDSFNIPGRVGRTAGGLVL